MIFLWWAVISEQCKLPLSSKETTGIFIHNKSYHMVWKINFKAIRIHGSERCLKENIKYLQVKWVHFVQDWGIKLSSSCFDRVIENYRIFTNPQINNVNTVLSSEIACWLSRGILDKKRDSNSTVNLRETDGLPVNSLQTKTIWYDANEILKDHFAMQSRSGGPFSLIRRKSSTP